MIKELIRIKLKKILIKNKKGFMISLIKLISLVKNIQYNFVIYLLNFHFLGKISLKKCSNYTFKKTKKGFKFKKI